MRRWSHFAGLAKKYQRRPVHFLFANPFEFHANVYPKVEKALTRVGLDRRPANFTFHRVAKHPLVDRASPETAPGWNSSNTEVTARSRFGCYAIFDKRGALVFRGRLSASELEQYVNRLLR